MTSSADEEYYASLRALADASFETMVRKNREYGASWKKRGGVGAFMMLARKWDRLEEFCSRNHYDIFKAGHADDRGESVLDDLRDLRNYLLLVEGEIVQAREQAHAPGNDAWSQPLFAEPTVLVGELGSGGPMLAATDPRGGGGSGPRCSTAAGMEHPFGYDAATEHREAMRRPTR